MKHRDAEGTEERFYSAIKAVGHGRGEAGQKGEGLADGLIGPGPILFYPLPFFRDCLGLGLPQIAFNHRLIITA